MHDNEVSLLYNNKGEYIAYLQVKSKANTSTPGVIFLSGFNSNMTGSKATALARYCQAADYGYVCFDYRGCGQSSGQFNEGTIGRWLEDVLHVIDSLTEGPQLLVGSSMGGWLMLLAALKRPERIMGLIGIAAAPDFTETLIWDTMDSAQKQALLQQGSVELPAEECSGAFVITRKLIEEGRNHLLLGGEISLTCPVRLLHGMNDRDVPYHTSLQIATQLESTDVEVHLVKNGDHRMSSPENIALLEQMVGELIGEENNEFPL